MKNLYSWLSIPYGDRSWLYIWPTLPVKRHSKHVQHIKICILLSQVHYSNLWFFQRRNDIVSIFEIDLTLSILTKRYSEKYKAQLLTDLKIKGSIPYDTVRIFQAWTIFPRRTVGSREVGSIKICIPDQFAEFPNSDFEPRKNLISKRGSDEDEFTFL